MAELSPSSFAVLGLLEVLQPATPYDLERYGGGGLFLFWSIPHTQIYSECARLVKSGHLAERREREGRRRRLLSLTEQGQSALEDWRSNPQTMVLEVRHEGLLKLYLGAPKPDLARAQAELHEQRAAFLEVVHAGADLSEGMQDVLEIGVAMERGFAQIWRKLAERES